jgi:hypothetical protein
MDKGHLLLEATRRLNVLDELRVPYEIRPAADSGPWQRLGPAGRRGLHWYRSQDGGEAHFHVGGIPVWGRVAPEAAVASYAATLGPGWRPAEPVTAADGSRSTSIWRSPEGGTLLPFDPDALTLNLRSERYHESHGSRKRSPRVLARDAYYAVRPLMPHALQIAMRRAYTRVQERSRFPRWPLEPAVDDISRLVLQATADAAGEPVPYLASWPHGHEWALVLTHDVEHAAGRDGIGRVRALEETLGYRSSWNLVPERYEVDDALVAELGASGHEVGVHGLRHDGHDLSSLRNLRERLPEMRRWAKRWGAVGFRSPATHRRWEWMPELGFDYDSSYPDTDPYEPMPGGCCSWLPFFNGDQVELPITLPQDHTLFVILRRDGQLWHEKAEALRQRGGMALMILHPDYVLEDEPLQHYERFLAAYAGDRGAWKALPRDVSAWWRRRAATSLELVDGQWRATGPASGEATVAFAQPVSEELDKRPVPAGGEAAMVSAAGFPGKTDDLMPRRGK